MIYNTTNLSGANNILEVTTAVNELAGGTVFLFVIAVLFLVVFSALSVRYGAANAFITSSFLSFFAGVVGWVTGLLSEAALLVLFMVFLASIFIKIVT